MRSSTGQHWIALDHIRALAAFLVFTWHFAHSTTGYPVAIEGAPAFFPFAILDEGHTGVALFMTLSGYLFAKLLDGRSIDYPMFFWNRVLRLAPLMVVAILIGDLDQYLTTGNADVIKSFTTVAVGFVSFAPLTNGLWSIVVETHFYVVLPLLMSLGRSGRWQLLLIVGAMVAVRIGSVMTAGASTQGISYWTIIGHIDQFILGIFAFQNRELVRKKHLVAGVTATGFLLFYYWFDAAGGWYDLPEHGWTALIWAVLPTVEGASYALLIAYYDGSFRPSDTGISAMIGKAGGYSYSIYLLHFFVVFRMARFIDVHVMSLSNIYVACLWSALCFALLVPFAQLCFRWIEAPFLKLRRPYIRDRSGSLSASAGQAAFPPGPATKTERMYGV